MFHIDPWGLSKDDNHNTVPLTEWPDDLLGHEDIADTSKYHWQRTGCQTCARRERDHR